MSLTDSWAHSTVPSFLTILTSLRVSFQHLQVQGAKAEASEFTKTCPDGNWQLRLHFSFRDKPSFCQMLDSDNERSL